MKKSVRNAKDGPWLQCDRCGFNVRLSDARKEWTGLMVCASPCYEARQPQDFVRAVTDKQTFPNARPAKDVFLAPGDVTPDDL